MIHKKSPEDTQEVIESAKNDLARRLQEVISTPGKSTEQLIQEIRSAAEFIAAELRVVPKDPVEGLVLTARRSLAVQVSDLLKGDEALEIKLEKVREFIGGHMIQSGANASNSKSEDRLMAEIVTRQTAGEELSVGERAYVEAREAGYDRQVADLMAWQAAAPSSLSPEETVYVELMKLGYGEEAAKMMKSWAARLIGKIEERHPEDKSGHNKKGAFKP